MADESKASLGISGGIARRFLTSEITPLLALVGLLLGVFAVLVTPKEEEPQINVTFANVFIPFPGASSKEVEQLVATPAEQVLSEISGIKHIYSVSYPGMAVLTVRYRVGEDRTAAIVRLYNAIFSNQDWLPHNLGVGQPVIKPKGIDDVPVVALTLWSEDSSKTVWDIQETAHALETELKRVPGTRDIYTIGGLDEVVHVQFQPDRLAAWNLSLDDLRQALSLANSSSDSGELASDDHLLSIRTGTFFESAEDVAGIIVAVRDGKPVYLRDVAEVSHGPDQADQYVRFGTGVAAAQNGISAKGEFPAVTVAIAKKEGTNAVAIAEQVISRLDDLQGIFIPDDTNVTVTRNYGQTADDKAMKLISKLVFATASVVLLVLMALGRREAIIVGTAVVITLAITLFASWAWGFTLNRVSLFALIFSIGILVDDAIVVVENIHRHMQLGDSNLVEIIPKAVDEVGGPTILATFTVIAALLPMAFVTGLMGPYMSPIPINASIGMLISLAVAFIVTPWFALKLLKPHTDAAHAEAGHSEEDKLYNFFRKWVGPFLQGEEGKRRRRKLWIGTGLLIVFSIGLVVVKAVVLKMLPFDNKSEFQVIVDMPEGTSLERTSQVLSDLGRYIATVPEVSDYQIYAGSAAPINFNGLVRQYYLREAPSAGDIQVNLVDKAHRHRKSHEIALSVREPLQKIAEPFGANVKIVEVPPGPPVQSPLVAEIYGLNYQGQADLAERIRQEFAAGTGVVDIDDSIEFPAPKAIIRVDQQKAALHGVNQDSISRAITTSLSGEDVTFLHDSNSKYPIPVRLEFPVAYKDQIDTLLATKVRNNEGVLIPIADLVQVIDTTLERAIYHKDLLPVTFVTADAAGDLDSPLYSMFGIFGNIGDGDFSDIGGLDQYLISPPDSPYRYSIKWDGEWQVTYETFRDMGIAYGVGMILIYLLVVAQFRSYLVPLIIMAPIPLTIIGVMPGHALLSLFGMDAKFTATSMIGMIALAGIIVRNSILLVDFINEQLAQGIPFEEAVIRSGAVRAKPIILTGLAAMTGAFFILDDPIFNGLAISLIFGILISTLLTLVIIPVLYYAARQGIISKQ